MNSRVSYLSPDRTLLHNTVVFPFLSVLLWLQLQQTSIAVPTCSTYLHTLGFHFSTHFLVPSLYLLPWPNLCWSTEWPFTCELIVLVYMYILEHSHAGSSDGGMKVIRHAGVDSRMICLDNQACQQMTRHFQLSQSCRIK